MYLDEFNNKDQLCEFEIELSKKYILDYYNSCGINLHEFEYIFPTELATLSLKYFLEKFPIPNGSIHTSQEIEINSPIEIGSKLICRVFLDSFKEIRGRGIIIVKTDYIRSEKILGSANATLLVPSL
ncbi:MAG: hypothetical protein CL762_01825 [Chloroflexi bacterium]|nr:hypothetical protein [Chloroflexota bacterium]|tara:strand:- start:4085 stop:4465 length:381 start_codon:yes stop_codon:yes gene_type:complete